MTTRTTTIGELVAGDTVTAIDGKDRPFPYVVTQVVNHPKYGKTHVKYAHGGFLPLAPSSTPVTVTS
jgi:hypothetical protein